MCSEMVVLETKQFVFLRFSSNLEAKRNETAGHTLGCNKTNSLYSFQRISSAIQQKKSRQINLQVCEKGESQQTRDGAFEM